MRSVGDGGLMGPTEENMVSNKANKDGGLCNGESCLEVMIGIS